MNADSRPSRPTLFVTIDMIIHTVRFQSPQRMSLARIIVRNEDASITRLRARTSPKSHAPHPRNLHPSTTTFPHTSQLRKEHTATHGSHLIEQIFKIQNRETSGPLATPPPADTALMPNSGSLCNGQGVQTYVEVPHPSIAVFFELSFSCNSFCTLDFARCAGFLLRRVLRAKPVSASWWLCVYCFNTPRSSTTPSNSLSNPNMLR